MNDMIDFLWFYLVGGVVSLGLLVVGARNDPEIQERLDRVADDRGDAFMAMVVLSCWLPLLLMTIVGGGGRGGRGGGGTSA